jgi:hypothetical protein
MVFGRNDRSTVRRCLSHQVKGMVPAVADLRSTPPTAPVPDNLAICLPQRNRSAFPMMSTKPSAVSGPTPGCVANRFASGHFSTSCSITCVSFQKLRLHHCRSHPADNRAKRVVLALWTRALGGQAANLALILDAPETSMGRPQTKVPVSEQSSKSHRKGCKQGIRQGQFLIPSEVICIAQTSFAPRSILRT